VKQFDIYVNPIAKGRKRYPFVCSENREQLLAAHDALFTGI